MPLLAATGLGLEPVHQVDDVVEMAASAVADDGDSETYYVSFVRRTNGNKIARSVKTADVLDNLNASLLSALTEKDMGRMYRYLAALRKLRDAEG